MREIRARYILEPAFLVMGCWVYTGPVSLSSGGLLGIYWTLSLLSYGGLLGILYWTLSLLSYGGLLGIYWSLSLLSYGGLLGIYWTLSLYLLMGCWYILEAEKGLD